MKVNIIILDALRELFKEGKAGTASVSDIAKKAGIEQGIAEGTFICSYPGGYAEIVMSVLTFLLDPGIFPWNGEEYFVRLKALADMSEKWLGAPEGSFGFLYK